MVVVVAVVVVVVADAVAAGGGSPRLQPKNFLIDAWASCCAVVYVLVRAREIRNYKSDFVGSTQFRLSMALPS